MARDRASGRAATVCEKRTDVNKEVNRAVNGTVNTGVIDVVNEEQNACYFGVRQLIAVICFRCRTGGNTVLPSPAARG